jgi:hypothetical protein
MLCVSVSEEVGDGEGTVSEAPTLLSYTLRYIRLAELGTLCQFGLREPMHLCACVSEEGGDGKGAGPLGANFFLLFKKRWPNCCL